MTDFLGGSNSSSLDMIRAPNFTKFVSKYDISMNTLQHISHSLKAVRYKNVMEIHDDVIVL